jgi:hypothetical protein
MLGSAPVVLFGDRSDTGLPAIDTSAAADVEIQ